MLGLWWGRLRSQWSGYTCFRYQDRPGIDAGQAREGGRRHHLPPHRHHHRRSAGVYGREYKELLERLQALVPILQSPPRLGVWVIVSGLYQKECTEEGGLQDIGLLVNVDIGHL